jgi:hypothetical protein
MVLLELEEVVPGAVYNPGLSDLCDPVGGVCEATMDVAMKKIPRPVAIDQTPVTLKSPVAGIFCIVDVPGRRMGNHDVEVPVPAQLRAQVADCLPHLSFRVL